MLEHQFSKVVLPKKVIVLGAGGFVGSNIVKALKGFDSSTVVPILREKCDLLLTDAKKTLAKIVTPGSSLVVVSARAPCKNYNMMAENVLMMRTVCEVIQVTEPVHILYISSDAVYADSSDRLNENSQVGVSNPHGMMHSAREVMLTDASSGRVPLAILRPTLIYGVDDPHNGYGPNRFRRLAQEGKNITLFGKGEELRDHVTVEDVAELSCRIVFHRSSGILNAATGKTISFRQIAELTAELAEKKIEVQFMPRTGEMPHNGYRAFDESATRRAFPNFSYTDPQKGIPLAYNAVMKNSNA